MIARLIAKGNEIIVNPSDGIFDQLKRSIVLPPDSILSRKRIFQPTRDQEITVLHSFYDNAYKRLKRGELLEIMISAVSHLQDSKTRERTEFLVPMEPHARTMFTPQLSEEIDEILRSSGLEANTHYEIVPPRKTDEVTE